MPTRRAMFTQWLPPILWMSLIFVGSTGVLAASQTSRFVVPFLRWVLGAGFTLEKAEFIHFLIRKGGHVTEYAILCVLLWRATSSLPFFDGLKSQPSGRFLFAVLASATYAASDEFHQSFIPSRTASPVDVAIDTVGATLGLLLFLGLAQVVRRWWRTNHLETTPQPDRS